MLYWCVDSSRCKPVFAAKGGRGGGCRGGGFRGGGRGGGGDGGGYSGNSSGKGSGSDWRILVAWVVGSLFVIFILHFTIFGIQ